MIKISVDHGRSMILLIGRSMGKTDLAGIVDQLKILRICETPTIPPLSSIPHIDLKPKSKRPFYASLPKQKRRERKMSRRSK